MIDIFGGRWATFSPDEQQVAYFGDSGLTIRNLVTYEEQYTERTLDSQMPGGHIIWSPDGSHIAYTIANRPCFDGWAASTTVIVVDIDTMAETALLSNDERRLVTVEWLDENHILVTDSETDRYFSVNTKTGSVIEADAPPRK